MAPWLQPKILARRGYKILKPHEKEFGCKQSLGWQNLPPWSRMHMLPKQTWPSSPYQCPDPPGTIPWRLGTAVKATLDFARLSGKRMARSP